MISDFPFPDTDEGLRGVPGRVMGAIQFFEAQIDDQLLPRAHYDTLLARHGFTDPGSASLTPMHALTGVAAGCGSGLRTMAAPRRAVDVLEGGEGLRALHPRRETRPRRRGPARSQGPWVSR